MLVFSLSDMVVMTIQFCHAMQNIAYLIVYHKCHMGNDEN